jgi:transcriptional regulator with XRE-family HTH domain
MAENSSLHSEFKGRRGRTATGGRPVVGSRMRAAMREAGLDIGTVAARLNCNRTTVHRWCSGDRSPSAHLLEQFAKLVNKPAAAFWADPGEDDQQRIFAGVVRVMNYMAERPGASGMEAAAAVIGPLHASPAEAAAFNNLRFAAIREELEAGAVRAFGRGWRRLTHAERVVLVIELTDALGEE